MIIRSFLDNDLYKFTMMQAVLHHFKNIDVEYQFILRDNNIDLSFLKSRVQQEANLLSKLSWQQGELDFLRQLPFFTEDFIEHISQFEFNPNYVAIDNQNNLEVTIRGPWQEVILFEIPLLMIISEVFYQETLPNFGLQEGRIRLHEKIDLIKNHPLKEHFLFADYGNRRRFSFAWHQEVLETLKAEVPTNFSSSSNVYFAKKFNLNPVGTMAHEFIQAGQALAPNLEQSQHFAWQKWLDEFGDQLSVALVDTLGFNCFLQDFNLHFSSKFSAVRQDSGDPFIWGEAIIKHYQRLGIDPKSKTIVFSDALTFPKALELLEAFHGRINIRFGIGTNLMHDIGLQALPIVIKMSECNGQAVAKISDSPEKTYCKDPQFLKKLQQSINRCKI